MSFPFNSQMNRLADSGGLQFCCGKPEILFQKGVNYTTNFIYKNKILIHDK
jgi:hypothetical protein